MPKIKIDRERCKGCQLCMVFCPKSLIKVDIRLNSNGMNSVTFLDKSECTGCTSCAIICPDCCIEVYK